MKIQSLKNTSNKLLYEAFSNAFADYEIQMNKKQLEFMLKRRGYHPELSFGAFDKGKLVAFTLNGIGKHNNILTAYDTGTGTTKKYRGMGLAKEIFNHSVPFLKKQGVKQYLLEVLQHNDIAVQLYLKAGFKVVREFYYYTSKTDSFKINGLQVDSKYRLTNDVVIFKSDLSEFFDFNPSWQNSFESVYRQPDAFKSFGIYHQDKLIAWVFFEPSSGDITQIAVHKDHRRRGLGSFLFKQALIQTNADNIKFINTDLSCESINGFLKSLIINPTGKQFEMIKQL